MKNVRGLLAGRPALTVTPDRTVLEVAQFMCEKRIGAVPIVEGEKPVGIFSERDLMERVVIHGRSPAETRVAEVMTRDVVYGAPDDHPFECMKKMQERGCRHLPVVEDGRLVGVLSLRDLLRVRIEEQEEEIKWMDAYIHDVPRGHPPR